MNHLDENGISPSLSKLACKNSSHHTFIICCCFLSNTQFSWGVLIHGLMSLYWENSHSKKIPDHYHLEVLWKPSFYENNEILEMYSGFHFNNPSKPCKVIHQCWEISHIRVHEQKVLNRASTYQCVTNQKLSSFTV